MGKNVRNELNQSKMAPIDSEWLKTFKNDRNELNQSKLAPDGQNQIRMVQIA